MAELLCLDPIGGIAGNMFLGMAVDLGVPLADLEKGLAALPVKGWRFQVERAARHSISGTWLDVEIDQGLAQGHRAYKAIREMVAGAPLGASVKARALGIFEKLAAAEGQVHGVPADEVEFHEVGAVDSIVDVVGAALAVELLGSPEIFCLPVPMGSGVGRAAHGAMPIPPPATVAVLAGRTVRFVGKGELTTPTGAALVAALTREASVVPEMILERVGYGVGTRDFPDRPNLLRGMLGRRAHAGDGGTYVLEANLDDASPQVLAFALDALLAAGALDVWISPLTMKKGRPGHLLGVLAPGDKRAALSELMLRETPTLGVRAHPVERMALERRFQTVETAYGKVQMKIGSLSGKDLNASPEFEDCARLAREKGVPLKDVLAAAIAAFHRR